MARPARIQYENAFYHVMNRGRGKRWIFHGTRYYEAFLKTLESKTLRGLANATYVQDSQTRDREVLYRQSNVASARPHPNYVPDL